LALGLHNTVELSEIDAGLAFHFRGEGADSLPRDAGNLVVRAAREVFRVAGRTPSGLRVGLNSAIPLASGLGSSAAALLGGIVAANALIDHPLSGEELLELAIDLEGHPDNVTAAFLGGLVISSYEGGHLVYKTVTVQPLQAVVVLPDVTLSTGAARDALPEEVPLKDAALNVGRAALVVQALVEGDYKLLGEAMRDRLHEPYRQKLIPGYDEAIKAARSKGAAAVAISGAGPSLLALAEDEHEWIARAMAEAFEKATGKTARTWILPIDTQGVALTEMATEMPLTRPRKKAPAPEPEKPAPAEPKKEEAPAPEAKAAPASPVIPASGKPLSLGEAAELVRQRAAAERDAAKPASEKPESVQPDDA
jgi:homoserine kinase